MLRDIQTPNLPFNDDDDNFDSVSSFEPTSSYPDPLPAPIPSILTTDTNNQTRIIPCKYAVRGTCRLGDQCLYLHDGKRPSESNYFLLCFVEACIQSAREWERRL